MKKIIAVVLVAVLAFMLCGCCLKHEYAPATCTEPETCTKCGKTQGEALGHTEETVAAVEPACTETGLTEGTVCSVCGEVLTAQEEIPALGHTEEVVAAVEPTCTETGLTEGTVCSVCGEVLTAQEEIPALGHDWTEATMTAPKTCSVCGETEGKAICDETALIINGTEYSTGYLSYAYIATYYDFLNSYGAYAEYFGLDLNTDPADQECMFAEGGTWKDYFLNSAIDTLKVNRGMLDYAAENGISVSEEESAQIADYINAYEETLIASGYESFEAALEEMYGPYASRDLLISDATNDGIVSKAYSAKANEIMQSLTEEDLAGVPRIDVRHILLQAHPNEDGTSFSQEALDKAFSRAEAVLRIYERGDMTEESFAQLAQLYSEDPGSAAAGGLYEAVAPGTMVEEFNDFCFDESRQPGDTAIVYGTNGSYAGYHVMYFSGKNTAASIETAVNAKLNEWIGELLESATVEKTEFFDSVSLK